MRRDPGLQLIGILPDRLGDCLYQFPLLRLSRQLARNDKETLRGNRRRQHSTFAVEDVSGASSDFFPRSALVFNLLHKSLTTEPLQLYEPATKNNPKRTNHNDEQSRSPSERLVRGSGLRVFYLHELIVFCRVGLCSK